jgi:hypothetical protein
MEENPDLQQSNPVVLAAAKPYELTLRFMDSGVAEVPRICYALAHNKVPIVTSLRVTSVSSEPSERLTLRFSGEWAVNARSPFKDSEIVLDAPGVGEAVEVAPLTSLTLSDIALAELEEMAPATLIIEILDDRGNQQVERVDFEIYPRDQWMSNLHYGVLTAAFVQPNHPDVATVLERAARVLERKGSPGLSGYQSAATGQHHLIAEAVFIALQEFVTSYVNPPASFEVLGQQVRPIDRVLQEKQGTCIDLACAYAACLEQAGLHPIIFLVEGHAFSGYLAEEGHLPSSLLTSWAAIQGYLDSGLLVGVETVGIPQGSSFSDALAAVQVNLNGEKMHGVIDVYRAHSEGIRPIPARVIRNNELVVVIDNGPSDALVIEKRDPVTRKLLPESVPARVQSWKNSLLDLSFRNRLLNLKIERQGIGVVVPVGKLGWIEDHLNEGGQIALRAVDSLDAVMAARFQRADQMDREALESALVKTHAMFAFVGANRFKSVVTRLISDSRTLEEETGANCLYLTLGSIKWSGKWGEYSSPIFLIPIRLKNVRGVDAVQIEMDATQTTTVNYCLLEALRVREQMQLTWFQDDMSDELGLDIEAGLEAMRREFREKGLDVQGFSVDQTAGVAVLDFKKFRLWRDLNDHWKEFMVNSLVHHLVETPREKFSDPALEGAVEAEIDDTSTICPQPADGSQIAAIEKALAGQTFVLEGPPGSGKSQTITNLLANAMLRGKKVLFVAEKQAALQEVQERLEAVQLAPYCLALHDSGIHPEVLRTQLQDSFEQRPALDERLHQQFEDEFAKIAEQLDEYRRKVYGRNEIGFSFASAFRRLGELGSGPVVEVPRNLLNKGENFGRELIRKTLDLGDATRVAQVGKGHPWGFVGRLSFEEIDRKRMGETLGAVLNSAKELAEVQNNELSEAFSSAVNVEYLETVADVLEIREMGIRLSPKDLAAVGETSWMANVGHLLDEWKKAILDLPQQLRGHEEILRREDLETLIKAGLAACETFPLGRKKRIEQSLGIVAAFFVDGQLNVSEVAADLRRLLTVYSDLVTIQEAIRTVPLLQPMLPALLPVTTDALESLRRQCEITHRAGVGLSNPSASHDALRSLWAFPGMLAVGLESRVRQFAKALTELFELLRASDLSIKSWADSLGIVNAVHLQSRESWEPVLEGNSYLPLQRWLTLKHLLSDFEDAGLWKMCIDIETGVLEASEATAALERGILQTTLQVRAEETDLDVFDSDVQTRRVRRFIELLTQRQKNAESVIPFYLFQSRRFAADVKTGKLGDFRTEINSVSKRRRGKSIRALIEKYPEIVSDLAPCFLMSPDSVAQFLPPGTLKFDIVVFDEASQIETADAVGTLGRANSAVIVGDSKQMPPTRFGVVGSEDDPSEADGEETGEDSVLEEALAAGVDPISLSWHYRSQDESLISFSNSHYYDHKLLTFPAPVDFQRDCGVFYRRVNGQFDHGGARTNQIEAQAIVEELTKRLDDPATADLTYGIVTLNIQQRNLVTSIVDSSTHEKIRELRETEDKKRRLFVLNLENVQGRERDVIILGTSFSRRADGGAMPLNFGPLTLQGGSRRLNVAITRAKRQFVVVSSFDPEDLGGATSEGMVHLREYLFSARQRSKRELVETSHEPNVAPQVREIARMLEDKGVLVKRNLGLSEFKIDLALTLPSHPDEWLVAVLIDSEKWSERSLAVDRDALPMIILEKIMRWQRVARVWVPSVRLNLVDVVEDLAEQVFLAAQAREKQPDNPEQSTRGPSPQEDAPTSAVLNVGIVPTVGFSGPPPGNDHSLPNEVPFQVHIGSGVPQDVDLLTSRLAQTVLESIVDTEGPLSVNQALKRVAKAFGLQRVRGNRLSEMSVLLGTRDTTEVAGEFYLWPASAEPDTWREVRRSTSDQREVAEISPYEIVNAMEELVRRSISISQGELSRWIANYFGASKVGASIAEHLQMCIDWGVNSGRLQSEGDQLSIP